MFLFLQSIYTTSNFFSLLINITKLIKEIQLTIRNTKIFLFGGLQSKRARSSLGGIKTTNYQNTRVSITLRDKTAAFTSQLQTPTQNSKHKPSTIACKGLKRGLRCTKKRSKTENNHKFYINLSCSFSNRANVASFWKKTWTPDISWTHNHKHRAIGNKILRFHSMGSCTKVTWIEGKVLTRIRSQISRRNRNWIILWVVAYVRHLSRQTEKGEEDTLTINNGGSIIIGCLLQLGELRTRLARGPRSSSVGLVLVLLLLRS